MCFIVVNSIFLRQYKFSFYFQMVFALDSSLTIICQLNCATNVLIDYVRPIFNIFELIKYEKLLSFDDHWLSYCFFFFWSLFCLSLFHLLINPLVCPNIS